MCSVCPLVGWDGLCCLGLKDLIKSNGLGTHTLSRRLDTRLYMGSMFLLFWLLGRIRSNDIILISFSHFLASFATGVVVLFEQQCACVWHFAAQTKQSTIKWCANFRAMMTVCLLQNWISAFNYISSNYSLHFTVKHNQIVPDMRTNWGSGNQLKRGINSVMVIAFSKRTSTVVHMFGRLNLNTSPINHAQTGKRYLGLAAIRCSALVATCRQVKKQIIAL